LPFITILTQHIADSIAISIMERGKTKRMIKLTLLSGRYEAQSDIKDIPGRTRGTYV